MSKNIRGLTQAIVNVSQINFIDALFNAVTATTVNGTDGEFTGTLTVNNLTINGTFSFTGAIDVDGVTTGTLKITALPQDNSDTSDRPLLFLGAADEVYKNVSLHYNPSTDKLTVGNLLADVATFEDVTVEDQATFEDVTVEGSTALGSQLKINSLFSMTTETCRLLVWDNAANPNFRSVRQTADLYYVGTTQTLHSPNINATTITGNLTGNVTGNVTATTITTQDLTADDVTCTVQVHTPSIKVDGSNSDTATMTIDSTDGITIEQVHGLAFKTGFTDRFKITTSQTHVYDDLQVDGQTTLKNTIIEPFNLPSSDLNYDFQYRLLMSRSNTTAISENTTLFFNPRYRQLILYNLRIDNEITSKLMRIDHGTVNAENSTINITTDGLTMQQVNGFMFRTGATNPRLQVTTTQTRIYDALQCDSTATITGLLTCDDITATGTATVDKVVCDAFEVTGQNFKLDIPASGIADDLAIPCWNGVQTSANPNPDKKLRHKGTVFTFKPSTSTMRCPNIDSTGTIDANILNATTLNVGTQSISNFSVSGDLTLSNLTTPTSANAYSILLKQSNNDKVIQTNLAKVTAGVNFLSGNHYLKAEELRANTFIVEGTGLPLNYTCVYSCLNYETVDLKWGQDKYIVLKMLASDGGTPQVRQYGKNLSRTTGTGLVIPSAFDFGSENTGDMIKLSDNIYAGMYEIYVSMAFQNTYNRRQMPRIRVMKFSGTWEEQPQINKSIEYMRYSEGELSTMTCQGPIYMSNVTTGVRIYTEIDEQSTSNPLTWNEVADVGDWAAGDITISFKYLGKASYTDSEAIHTY